MFSNPGTTELSVIYALGKQSELPQILGLQEFEVTGVVDGFGPANGLLTADA